MRTILITDEEDRAVVYHEEDPDVNHFSVYIMRNVEVADDWIHIMPTRIKLMKSRHQSSLGEIRKMLAMKVIM